MAHQHLPGMSVIAIGGEVDHSTSAELAGYIDVSADPATM
jgi:hypothetical protein